MSTADHLKSMAAATHVEISQRGNPVPLLRLEVRYGASHVRTRAIDERGRYTDSIGANDLTEAVLLVGQVVRFGETMHARRLREKPPVNASPSGRFVRLTEEQISAITESLDFSLKRIRDSTYPGEDPAEAASRRRYHEERFASVKTALASERERQ